MIFTLFHVHHLRDSPAYKMIYDDLTNHDAEDFITNGGLPAGKGGRLSHDSNPLFSHSCIKINTTKCTYGKRAYLFSFLQSGQSYSGVTTNI